MLAANLAHLLKGDRDAQNTVADRVGVTQPTISKWSRMAETGSSSEPEFRKIAKLAQVLNVSLDDLAWRDLASLPPRSASQAVGLDPDKMTLVLDIVEGAIADSGKSVERKLKARMIKRVYEDKHALSGAAADAVRLALAGFLETVGE